MLEEVKYLKMNEDNVARLGAEVKTIEKFVDLMWETLIKDRKTPN